MLRLPKYLPPLSLLLDDLGSPPPRVIARALGVTERTVRRWIADDRAPRPAALALFWLTRWGVSQVDAEAVNAARLHSGMAQCLADEVATLRRELARVVSLGDFGCANQPLARPVPARAEVIPLAPRFKRS